MTKTPISLVTPPQPNADVPVEAFRFAADFTPGSKAEDGTVPFSTLARTAKPIDHWYWGPCIHDFGGLSMAAVIPVDYGHCDQEALGFINAKTVTPEGLQLSGMLTPFGENDKASEVVYKSGKGVPYQSSIYFDPWSCVVEDVPGGFTTEVNGSTINGPVAVFRQWQLMGLALCMYGMDSGTHVAFSKDLSGKTAAVSRFTKGEAMPGVTKKMPSKAVGKLADGDTKKDDEEETSTEGETEETEEERKKREEGEQSDDSEKKPEDDDAKLSRKDLGAKFIGAFGKTHGPNLFAKGLTFKEATTEFSKLLLVENESLKAQVTKLSQTPKPGEGTDPLSFGGNGTPVVPTRFSGLGRIGRFAAGIKLPGK